MTKSKLPVRDEKLEELATWADIWKHEVAPDKSIVVKRFSGLKKYKDFEAYNLTFHLEDYSDREEAVSDALAHAKFFRSLVGKVHPPGTEYLVCDDDNGNPTLMSITRYLDRDADYLPENVELTYRRDKVIAGILKSLGLKPHGDLDNRNNYRFFDYSVYYADSHVYCNSEDPRYLMKLPKDIIDRFR
ncbi:hypothetical protein JXA85_03285 [Candidatus Woesearchaeota archaeon]|nr:hypothetical protein [Candidatus Woesearchaeota archaeon]